MPIAPQGARTRVLRKLPQTIAVFPLLNVTDHNLFRSVLRFYAEFRSRIPHIDAQDS
jgi:hypothetical protein